MSVAGFSFGGRLFERVQQWQASMKVSLRVQSGGTQAASFDDHNLSLSAWSSSWSFPTGLTSHHQHPASDFIVGQAAQLSSDLDLILGPVCQTLRGCNSLVETRRIVARAPMAPRGRYGFLAVHRLSPTSTKQTRQKAIYAMHNCRRLGPGWSQSGVLVKDA
jgi:hypothetical protein